MRTLLAGISTAALLAGSALLAAPAHAGEVESGEEKIERHNLLVNATDTSLSNGRINHLGANPSQIGISGCFMPTAELYVTSGTDTLKVWDVSKPTQPEVVGTLINPVFENEAMNCGERRTKKGTKRFALVGVDLVQASPDDPQHVNIGGGELIVVDVTNPRRPTIRSRTEGSTSTHTVACVDPVQCRYAYSAGDSGAEEFSIFDLRRLNKPVEIDRNKRREGLQAFHSPTAGHKWNFDAAGVGTHTGFDGSSMWSTKNPRKPKLLVTTGAAGRGEDPRYEGFNDFIHHNSFRPNAKKFKPNRKPSLGNGNILLVTEEDYEDVNCSTAGSFQTWWVKRLERKVIKRNGKVKNVRRPKLIPLDKVELSDLGNFPLPVGAFCSAHWFDYRAGGLVAIGYYGGGTQILNVRNPKDIKPYAHSIFGLSEVWDAMWVPVYTKSGRMTQRKTNIVYSVDLVRGLDVYAVDVPGDGRGAVPAGARRASVGSGLAGGAVPLGLVALAGAAAIGLRRRRVTA